MANPKNLRRKRKQTKEKAPPGMGKFWLSLAAVIFYPLTFLLGRIKLFGLERVPAEGPALLVLNHISHLDPLYDGVAVHKAARIPRFLAKSTLWDVPVLKNVLLGVRQIPVFRGTADARKSLEKAHQALNNGMVILIYPDGTITKDSEGWPMPPKVGVARLALEHDVPVIPVARWGTRQIYDGYNKRFRPLPRKQVTYSFGEPIDLSKFWDREMDNQLLREVAELTMSRVRDQLGEIRGEQPPAEFYSGVRKRSHDQDD